MTFGERLVELRKSKNYTRESLAEKLKISKYTLRNYELSVNEPGSSFLKQVSDFFNVSIDYLMGMTEEKEKIRPYNLKASEYAHIEKYRSLDLFGQETVNMVLEREVTRARQLAEKDSITANLQNQISSQNSSITILNDMASARRMITYYHHVASAGNGEYLFDDIPTDLISVPDSPIAQKADFVLGVTGNSMEPTFHDGDKVFVEKTDIVQIGEIGIFFIGNECFIKEAAPEGLKSHNPAYHLIPGTESIRCAGRVLGKVEGL